MLTGQQIDSGRIVVDPDMYASQQGDSDRLTPLHAEPEAGSLPPPPPFDDPFAYPGDHHMASRPRMKRRSSTVKVENAKENPGTLEEHQYRLCTSIVKGYDMTSKQWAIFNVNGISEIKFSTAAFRRLVLPHDYKELILAFVDSHLNKEDEFDDIIEGKGRGMIVLLHGSPGLGKTLTAEAVAEEMKVPLYAMSAGQLGFDVETMEYALQDVLDICAKWGAVLLLDEADVFLEQRQLTDLQRNRLVSSEFGTDPSLPLKLLYANITGSLSTCTRILSRLPFPHHKPCQYIRPRLQISHRPLHRLPKA